VILFERSPKLIQNKQMHECGKLDWQAREGFIPPLAGQKSAENFATISTFKNHIFFLRRFASPANF